MKDVAGEVRRRAGGKCEYCGVPQSAFSRLFHIEHIIAKQHGGLTELDNLALACLQCNLKKGPNLTGIDTATGEVARLFNPRKDLWAEHFKLSVLKDRAGGIEIQGLTAIGRATVHVLGMNEEMRPRLRYELSLEGVYEPAQ